MKLFKLLKEIFLLEGGESCLIKSPKNVTPHYLEELGEVYFDEVCVGGNYSNLEERIERYKYHSDRHISTELVDILSKCVEVSHLFHCFDDWVVLPVPMHWTRYFLRGFHHTKKIGIEFSKFHQLKYASILGTKWTRRQSHLSRLERILNKKNSFFLKNKYTVPSHILLIDDVISSGSTLNEAAKVLSQNGAEVILCFVIASNA